MGHGKILWYSSTSGSKVLVMGQLAINFRKQQAQLALGIVFEENAMLV
jgi:hypothetical protein